MHQQYTSNGAARWKISAFVAATLRGCVWQVTTEVSEGIAEAQGPVIVQFTPGDAPGQLTGVLQMAGAYVVHVRLGASAVTGWPRVLHVVASRAHAPRSAFCQTRSNSPPYEVALHQRV